VHAIRSQPPVIFLEAPHAARRAEFIAAARRSRPLHRSWVKPPSTRAEYDRWLARAADPARCPFLICEESGGELVGVATLSEIVRGPLQSAYLGYYLFSPWEGRGFMTAGLRLVLREAFGRLKLHRVEANIQPGNDASRAVLKRLGFVREGFSRRYLKIAGRWRDHERWAILAEDWKPAPRR
jgi:[ribosomal protein S5]-alanine N-acetyltransferase